MATYTLRDIYGIINRWGKLVSNARSRANSITTYHYGSLITIKNLSMRKRERLIKNMTQRVTTKPSTIY